jgi:hypothetical protein
VNQEKIKKVINKKEQGPPPLHPVQEIDKKRKNHLRRTIILVKKNLIIVQILVTIDIDQKKKKANA